MKFEEIFSRLDPDTRQVLFAALWAGLDVHAPLDNLTQGQLNRLEELANFTNSELS